MLTVLVILVLLALVLTIAAAVGKCPLWLPVFVICVYLLLLQLPLGKT